MAILTWDNVGERFYETGVDKGVLYMPDSQGAYINGVAWNGLTSVSESPLGAESNPQYADNIKYLNLISAEEFSATLEAFTYPDEFAAYDGLATPTAGVTVGQQPRKTFGLSYRTLMGNDLEGNEFGYKIHLIYGCQASPSEKAYNTVNDSPEAITFSWEVSTTPAPVTGSKPTSVITIDSTKVDATALSTLEDFLYGTAGTDPSLPTPDDVVALFSGSVTEVTPTEPGAAGNDVTIPVITGVAYYDNNTGEMVSGLYTITEDTVISARPTQGYKFPAVVDTDWLYVFA
jgi:hypothetical protein